MQFMRLGAPEMGNQVFRSCLIGRTAPRGCQLPMMIGVEDYISPGDQAVAIHYYFLKH